MNRKLALMVVGFIFSVAISGAFAQGKVSGDVVKIGVLTDMSGLYADLSGQGSVTAAQMAAAELGNKVLGKPVQVVYSDHQNKADVGANKAREWFDTQGVDVIVDGVNSGVALAISKIASEKHRLYYRLWSGLHAAENEDCGPYTIHYTYDIMPPAG